MPLSRRSFVRGLGSLGVATAAFDRTTAIAAAARAPEGSASAGGRVLRLDRGYNPYGPSPGVLDAIRSFSLDLPDADVRSGLEPLRDAIAARHGVPRAGVVLACGSTELLRASVRTFAGDGAGARAHRAVVAATPTSDIIARLASAAGAPLVEVPLTREYAHDVPAMLARCGTASGLVYVCNPNTPTATLTQRRDLDRLLDRLPAGVTPLVDETYFDYVDPSPDAASLVDRASRDMRLIVTRTFSTSYGLPGFRIGYAVTSPATARALADQGLEDGLSVPAIRAAAAALADREYLELTASRNADDRQEFQNQVNARMLRSLDSQANFVLLDTGRHTAPIIEHFRRHDVILAPSIDGLPHHVRVSIGREEQMQTFWRVWDLMPPGPMVM